MQRTNNDHIMDNFPCLRWKHCCFEKWSENVILLLYDSNIEILTNILISFQQNAQFFPE